MGKSQASFLVRYNISTPITFLVIALFFIFFIPNYLFIDPRNLAIMGKLMPDLGIIVLGVGMLMISGEFDLSIASVLPFCSYFFTLFLVNSINPLLALILVLPIGAVFGFINGFIVTKTGLPSFIITLSTLMFWRGLLYGISQMRPVSISRYIQSGSFFEKALVGKMFGAIPLQIIWFIAIAIVLGLVLHATKFGNWVYATGSNKLAARAMGINTNMVKMICYIIVGILCAFVSVLQATRIESFAATQGVGFELKAVAAAVVGGVALRGGVGNMLGIFLGVLIIKMLENGLILMKVPVFGVETFIGLAIIIFAALNSFINRRMAL